MDEDCPNTQYEMCLICETLRCEWNNGTHTVDGCEVPFSQDISSYACIPLKLGKTPR